MNLKISCARPAYLPFIKSILGFHVCPVCQQKHTWRDKTYEYTRAFYSIPPKFQEICFDCLNLAMNNDPRGPATDYHLTCLFEIFKIIDTHPNKDMYEVVFSQCKNITEAAQVIRIMKGMCTFQKLQKKHGSWFAVLVRSGCLPEGTRKEQFGTRVLAKDGHVCLSLGEMQIDDLMHSHSISHQKEVPYPNSNMICDWVIQIAERKMYVEYFGLQGNKEYDEKIEEKRHLAIENNLNLIEFYPFDFADIESAFRKKILQTHSV